MTTHGGKRVGAGRPRGVERRPLNVTVLPETFDAIAQRSFRLNKTRGEVLDRAFKKKSSN